MTSHDRWRSESALLERPRPVVTVTGGPPAVDAPRSSRLGPTALVLAALAVLVAGALVGRAPPPPPPPLAVEVELGEQGPTAGDGGVLVVPVRLVNRGPALSVEDTVVYAEPVRSPAVGEAGRRLEHGATAWMAVRVLPDCALLAPDLGLTLAVTVELRLHGDDGQRDVVVLDVGREPAVAAGVAALCGPGAASILALPR